MYSLDLHQYMLPLSSMIGAINPSCATRRTPAVKYPRKQRHSRSGPYYYHDDNTAAGHSFSSCKFVLGIYTRPRITLEQDDDDHDSCVEQLHDLSRHHDGPAPSLRMGSSGAIMIPRVRSTTVGTNRIPPGHNVLKISDQSTTRAVHAKDGPASNHSVPSEPFGTRSGAPLCLRLQNHGVWTR